jgi:hypothetical protein
MDRPPRARPEASPRDPFRRPRGSYEPFGAPNGGRSDPGSVEPDPGAFAEQSGGGPVTGGPSVGGPAGAAPPPPPPPPAHDRGPGWDDYDLGAPPPPHGRAPDLSILVVLVEALRRLVPGDLQGQFNSLLREVLKTLRSLIDWYLDRLDRDRRAPQVEDIPID